MMPAQITTQPIIRTRHLTVDDLSKLPIPIKIQGNSLIIERSSRGWKLRRPITVSMEKVLAAKEKGLIVYIVSAFTSERPSLIPFVFDNQSLIKLARHFLRHCSGSHRSLYTYVDNISRYTRFLGHSPDMIIQDVKAGSNIPDPMRIQNHIGFLEDYLASLQDEGLSPGRVHHIISDIRTFYRVNGVEVKLTEHLSRRITYKDRAPTPEELTRLLEIADLRTKTIVSMLALGGFRESTLSMLQYRHVKEDLEKGITPIHIHVEADITKGKYSDFDTFLGQEAAEYLKLYLDQRRQGSPDGRAPPEKLTDTSPLIRDETSHDPRPIGPKQFYKLVHQLYAKAGLLKAPRGRMYELRLHSLRKYFKTQLLALGVQSDYVDYMMGHTVDTYHDIQSLGVEKLRNVYAAAGLSIKPKTKVSKIDALKEIIRAWGMNPEQVLARDALSQGATVHINPQDRENHHLQVLRQTLKELIRQETNKS